MSEPRVHLTIKGQRYCATFVAATTSFGPHYRIVRQEQATDNLRGAYIVRVNESGQPLSCSCQDYHYRNRAYSHGCPNLGQRWCKHCVAIDGIRLNHDRSFHEHALRTGAVVKTEPPAKEQPTPSTPTMLSALILENFVAMHQGDVWESAGHRVERLASGWKVDERFVSSWNELRGCLIQTTPCQAREPRLFAPLDYLDGN